MTVLAVVSPVVATPFEVMVHTVGGVNVGHGDRQKSKHPPQIWPQSSEVSTQMSGQLRIGGRGTVGVL